MWLCNLPEDDVLFKEFGIDLPLSYQHQSIWKFLILKENPAIYHMICRSGCIISMKKLQEQHIFGISFILFEVQELEVVFCKKKESSVFVMNHKIQTLEIFQIFYYLKHTVNNNAIHSVGCKCIISLLCVKEPCKTKEWE